MIRLYQFLKDCKIFYILTADEKGYLGETFGAIIELGGELYFSTSSHKDVCKKIINSPNISIVALKRNTKDWVSISCTANPIFDSLIKQAIMCSCPQLYKHFRSAFCKSFVVFKLNVLSVEVCEKDELKKII